MTGRRARKRARHVCACTHARVHRGGSHHGWQKVPERGVISHHHSASRGPRVSHLTSVNLNPLVGETGMPQVSASQVFGDKTMPASKGSGVRRALGRPGPLSELADGRDQRKLSSWARRPRPEAARAPGRRLSLPQQGGAVPPPVI